MNETPSIRILPDHVANQIAAGEVVERPVAVVKELVENSLDAGGSRIEVEFSAGGRNRILVADNGCGMSHVDALASLERHATSKLRVTDDLLSLSTLGFRGEALPSIASISRFTLQTRRKIDREGTEVRVVSGKVAQPRACGMAPGTRVEVAQLFHTVPARRKFLKSDATESAHIVQAMRGHALARPDVGFTLRDGSNTVFRLLPVGSPLERIASVWGQALADELIELEPATGEGGSTLRGFVSQPGMGRASRRDILTFVNCRPVESRTLAYALIEAFHTHIPKGRYPMAFLWVDINPALVDVNIHPSKREIKFRDEGPVRRLLIQSVAKALGAWSRDRWQFHVPGCPTTSTTSIAPEPVFPPEVDSGGAVPQQRTSKPEPTEIIPHGTPRKHPNPKDLTKPRYTSEESATTAAPQQGPQEEIESDSTVAGKPIQHAAPERANHPWQSLGLLGESDGLFRTGDDLIVVSLHAALQRIHYETILASFDGETVVRQALLFPIVLDLAPVAAAALEDWLERLEATGITLEPFGRNCFRVTQLPAWLPEAEVRPFVDELIESIRSGSLSSSNSLAVERFARLAARRARVTPEHKHPEGLRKLAEALRACRFPHSTPDGKPTLFAVNASERRRRLAVDR